MTVNEVARRIGISASKVYQLVSARRIAHYRIGGKIIFSEPDVASFLESCHVGTAAPVAAVPHMRPKLKHLSLG